MTGPQTWFLDSSERGNSASLLYRDRDDGRAWSEGNAVRPLVDGATYFARLCEELRTVGEGDLVCFVDWRGDPDERLDGPGSAVLVELARARSAGADVFGLVWRSHLDRFRFSEEQNRNLAQGLQSVNARVVLDMRVRRGGSHHQKFVVIRHRHDPSRDVAFVGGTDLGHGRRDDARHGGDPQTQPMSHHYGETPPWHDAMVEIRGPAVADVECCFRERWTDPSALQHDRPWLWALDRLRGVDGAPHQLAPQWPPPPLAGEDDVQLLRSYPSKSPPYPFAPDGERTVARGYAKAIARAEHLIYVEDQFLWSTEVASFFADALRRRPRLKFVAVLPRFPDVDSAVQVPAKDVAHAEAISLLRSAGGERVHFFDVENASGTPIYVHAKVCVIDDTWAAVGSANLNRRSWTHDSELTAAVLSRREPTFARQLRLRLWTEHLGRASDDVDDLLDLGSAPSALAASAERLESWHASGRLGSRPAGQLRPHPVPTVSAVTRRAVRPFLQLVVDPDGRPRRMRTRHLW